MSLENIFESGRTRRYHANPQLCHFNQTTADHSWGVVAVLLHIHPNPTVNLLAHAIFHDSGERWAGDLPYPFKQQAPQITKAHEQIEHQLAEDNGIPVYPLTPEEYRWLNLADRLESYLWTKLHRPEIMGEAWADMLKTFHSEADTLGVLHKLEGISL